MLKIHPDTKITNDKVDIRFSPSSHHVNLKYMYIYISLQLVRSYQVNDSGVFTTPEVSNTKNIVNRYRKKHTYTCTYVQSYVHVYEITMYEIAIYMYIAVFCPGYLEWWLDSTSHLVLFIQYILISVSVAYMCTCMYYLRGG